ncbi:MAG: hypothetical protein JXX14_20745 [Deltaproteobacteria bacterium]|nr:hypothetical protein [Deltaproteobacteria bacterium]
MTRQKKSNMTIYTFNMITVTVAIISAATTVFLATRHGEMAARINALQQAQPSSGASPEKTVSLAAAIQSGASTTPDNGLQIFVGAYQLSDMQSGMVQFWIPAKGFKVSSDAFSAEEIARCEQHYLESVQTLETELMTYAEGWNVSGIDGCWAPDNCSTAQCAVCEPGKIYTVVVNAKEKVKALAQKLAAPEKGLIQRLFCQDATLLITRYADGNS